MFRSEERYNSWAKSETNFALDDQTKVDEFWLEFKDSQDDLSRPVYADIAKMPQTKITEAEWHDINDILKFRIELVYNKYFIQKIPFLDLPIKQQVAF